MWWSVLRTEALSVWLICVLLLGSAANRVAVDRPESNASRSAAYADTLFNPSPDLSPEDVVRIQLEALQRNDDPYTNAGIETTYRFASPQNRGVTGPLNRFIELVRNPLYKPLIGHWRVQYGPVEVNDQVAHQAVIVVAKDDRRVGYLFTMSRQTEGDCTGCWMTDGVLRVEVETNTSKDALKI